MTNRGVIVAALLTAMASISTAGILIESEVSYEQVVSTNTGTQTLTDGVGPIPADLDVSFNTANAEYRFETNVSGSTPFELRSQAKLEVDIDARGSELGWNSVSASARAVGGLVDTAIIDGVPGQAGGFIEFLWSVTGISTIELDPQIASDAYFINELSTVAILNPSEGGGDSVEVFRDEPSVPPGTTSVSSLVPGFFSQQVFAVDWFAGQDFDVFFELATTSRLDVTNLDAAGFEAVVDADFTNTGTLQEIRIFDNAGNLLPGATLTSTDPLGPDYASLIVPEPASGASLAFLFVMVACGVRIRRRRQPATAL